MILKKGILLKRMEINGIQKSWTIIKKKCTIEKEI